MALVHRRHEQPLTEFLYRKAVHDKVPLSGTFELSPVCNLSCRMCYVRKSVQEVQNSQRPIMTKEEWLETARQMQKEGTLFLLLTGNRCCGRASLICMNSYMRWVFRSPSTQMER